MGQIYLVRHGQASFGQADYDNLSALGAQQGERLGAYFQRKGIRFSAALRGTLRRHEQTLSAIERGAGTEHKALAWPGLNEYDSHALIDAIHPAPLPAPDTPELYRHHFRLLREALTAANEESQKLVKEHEFSMEQLRVQHDETIRSMAASTKSELDNMASQLLEAKEAREREAFSARTSLHRVQQEAAAKLSLERSRWEGDVTATQSAGFSCDQITSLWSKYVCGHTKI
jgi:broad specificity phosphatase PhoE